MPKDLFLEGSRQAQVHQAYEAVLASVKSHWHHLKFQNKAEAELCVERWMAKNNFKIPPLENKDAAAAYHEVKSEVLRKLRQRGWIMYPENQMSNKLTWNEDTYRSGANRAHKAVLATFELHRKHFDFKTKAEAQLYVGKRMVETGFAIPPLKDYDAAAAFHEVKLEVLRKLRGSGWIKYPDNDNDPGIQRRQQQSSSETACEDPLAFKNNV